MSLQKSFLVGKYFVSTRPLVPGQDFRIGRVIERADSNLFVCEVFNFDGEQVALHVTLSSGAMNGFCWSENKPVRTDENGVRK